MTTPRAADLPRHSIVATATRVWKKWSNEGHHPAGTPFYECGWIEATTYAVSVPNGEICHMLRSGEATVLRVGDGRVVD